MTNVAAETMTETASVPEVDQLQQETDKIEQVNDDACVNSITNQKNKSGRYEKLASQEKRSSCFVFNQQHILPFIKLRMQNPQ